jgi:hypothetical protein
MWGNVGLLHAFQTKRSQDLQSFIYYPLLHQTVNISPTHDLPMHTHDDIAGHVLQELLWHQLQEGGKPPGKLINHQSHEILFAMTVCAYVGKMGHHYSNVPFARADPNSYKY